MRDVKRKALNNPNQEEKNVTVTFITVGYAKLREFLVTN